MSDKQVLNVPLAGANGISGNDLPQVTFRGKVLKPRRGSVDLVFVIDGPSCNSVLLTTDGPQ